MEILSPNWSSPKEKSNHALAPQPQILLKASLAEAGGSIPRRPIPITVCPVFTNRIKDLEVKNPNEVWVGDLTYLRTEEGFVYLWTPNSHRCADCVMLVLRPRFQSIGFYHHLKLGLGV